jgi:hypothetical protein
MKIIASSVICWLALFTLALASGSYPPPIVRPPTEAVSTGTVDSTKYNLGKELIANKVRLPETPPSVELKESQGKVLAAYSEKLPKPVRETTDLQILAGKLSSEQMAAVAYFLTTRYKVKLDPL